MIMHRNVSRPLTKAGKLSLLMTIMVLLFIVSIIGTARLSLKFSGAATDKCAPSQVMITDRTGLSGTEADILEKLAGSLGITESGLERKGGTDPFGIYYQYLEEQYRNTGFLLDKNDVTQINELINDLDELIHLEQQSQIGNMSLDGREVAVYILGEIYGLSGLKLEINNEGEIGQISDPAGKVLYQYSLGQQTEFRYDALVIIVAVILILISICFRVARRQQLFEKGGEFGGIKEKRIA